MSRLTHQNATRGHQGDDVAALLAQAEALCRTVARRDLADTPLYVVPQSSLPAECGSGDHCFAFTAPSLDIYLRDHIPGWRGRGPCMVVNDAGLAEDYEREDLAYVVPAYVLHELAHILDRPALFADRSGVDPSRLKFEALVVADVTRRPVRDDLPAYFGHGHSFIRIAVHLCHRAQQAGFDVCPAAICAGYRYGLSHASRYVDALGDEPRRCADWLFRDILAAKPPWAFSRLWTEDVVSYHQRFPFQKGSAS
ncbi:MAG: hypothetical protein D6760_11385 [Deltaproteobacteria bacterium]|nr:MAG: hypothetical protein D6760_11385 [Deltaproteobacteria bacterium]